MQCYFAHFVNDCKIYRLAQKVGNRARNVTLVFCLHSFASKIIFLPDTIQLAVLIPAYVMALVPYTNRLMLKL